MQSCGLSTYLAAAIDLKRHLGAGGRNRTPFSAAAIPAEPGEAPEQPPAPACEQSRARKSNKQIEKRGEKEEAPALPVASRSARTASSVTTSPGRTTCVRAQARAVFEISLSARTATTTTFSGVDDISRRPDLPPILYHSQGQRRALLSVVSMQRHIDRQPPQL